MGATLKDVESLLGKVGHEIPEEEVPNIPNRPAVRGQRYFIWSSPNGVGYIIVALANDGKVCDKYMFHSSL